MTLDRDITVAICARLGTIPGWVWSPDTPPVIGDVAVFYGAIPEAPDRAVGVRVYGGSDSVELWAPTRRVQIVCRGSRGDRGGADDLAGQVYAALQRWSGDGISVAARTFFAPLGADTEGREERSDNYHLVIDNLEARDHD